MPPYFGGENALGKSMPPEPQKNILCAFLMGNQLTTKAFASEVARSSNTVQPAVLQAAHSCSGSLVPAGSLGLNRAATECRDADATSCRIRTETSPLPVLGNSPKRWLWRVERSQHRPFLRAARLHELCPLRPNPLLALPPVADGLLARPLPRLRW